jgi:hypothetical protein
VRREKVQFAVIRFYACSTTPLLMSRNLNESVLKDWRSDEDAPLARLGAQGGAEGYSEPYGGDAVVVIRFGGSGEVISRQALLWKNLNPDAAVYPILQP